MIISKETVKRPDAACSAGLAVYFVIPAILEDQFGCLAFHGWMLKLAIDEVLRRHSVSGLSVR